jgi:hypothetical protein
VIIHQKPAILTKQAIVLVNVEIGGYNVTGLIYKESKLKEKIAAHFNKGSSQIRYCYTVEISSALLFSWSTPGTMLMIRWWGSQPTPHPHPHLLWTMARRVVSRQQLNPKVNSTFENENLTRYVAKTAPGHQTGRCVPSVVAFLGPSLLVGLWASLQIEDWHLPGKAVFCAAWPEDSVFRRHACGRGRTELTGRVCLRTAMLLG